MGKKLFFTLLALCLATPMARALELKNPRLTHGPLGALRTETKFLPGDYLFMSFEIDGLTFDPKTGKASYETLLELYDSAKLSALPKGTPAAKAMIFDKKTSNEVGAMLGGTRIPGDLHVIMGRDQAPGKYIVRLIVKDKLSNQLKYFDYPFELLPKGFGLVGVTAPAVGFTGQHYVCSFALVDMTLDSKGKPNVDVNMRVLDQSGVALAKPIVTLLPKDLPEPPNNIDLTKENFVPMQFPIYLNRSGRFIIEVEATDRATSKTQKLRYSLTVIDVETVTGR